jgi:hypothetical protein
MSRVIFVDTQQSAGLEQNFQVRPPILTVQAAHAQ